MVYAERVALSAKIEEPAFREGERAVSGRRIHAKGDETSDE